MEGLDLVSVGVDSELESVSSEHSMCVGEEDFQAKGLVDVRVLDYGVAGQLVDVDQGNFYVGVFVLVHTTVGQGGVIIDVEIEIVLAIFRVLYGHLHLLFAFVFQSNS